MNKLYNTFHDHFEVVSADTVGLMERAYRIRYQVYCVERSFEDPEDFPDQMETDVYDLHSAHSLVRCKGSGQYTGLVRLVLPNPVDQNMPLPMEKYCQSGIKESGINLSSIPRDSLAEISRFSISRELKRQCSSKSLVSIVDNKNEQEDTAVNTQIMPHITLGLFARKSIKISTYSSLPRHLYLSSVSRSARCVPLRTVPLRTVPVKRLARERFRT